jgi:hypothetical protein
MPHPMPHLSEIGIIPEAHSLQFYFSNVRLSLLVKDRVTEKREREAKDTEVGNE